MAGSSELELSVRVRLCSFALARLALNTRNSHLLSQANSDGNNGSCRCGRAHSSSPLSSRIEISSAIFVCVEMQRAARWYIWERQSAWHRRAIIRAIINASCTRPSTVDSTAPCVPHRCPLAKSNTNPFYRVLKMTATCVFVSFCNEIFHRAFGEHYKILIWLTYNYINYSILCIKVRYVYVELCRIM